MNDPLKWLLAELPAYIEPAPLAALLERYEAHKAAYHREGNIRELTQRLNDTRKAWDEHTRARWQAKLDKMKAEQAEAKP